MASRLSNHRPTAASTYLLGSSRPLRRNREGAIAARQRVEVQDRIDYHGRRHRRNRLARGTCLVVEGLGTRYRMILGMWVSVAVCCAWRLVQRYRLVYTAIIQMLSSIGRRLCSIFMSCHLRRRNNLMLVLKLMLL